MRYVCPYARHWVSQGLLNVSSSIGVRAERAGLTKALCRSADAADQPNVLMLLAHLATTQTQLTELPPAVLEVGTHRFMDNCIAVRWWVRADLGWLGSGRAEWF